MKPLICACFLALFCGTCAFAQSFSESSVSGTLFVQDLTGKPIPIPWQDKELLARIIEVEGRDLSEGETRVWTLQQHHKTIDPGSSYQFADFSVTLIDTVYTPAHVHLKVAREGYYLDTRIYSFARHEGKRPVGNFYIERRHANDGERREAVLALIDASVVTDASVNEALFVVDGLLRDRENPEDFSFLVAIIEKVVVNDLDISNDLLSQIQRLLEPSGAISISGTNFENLEKSDQFKILAGIAHWISRSQRPHHQIQPNLTNHQLAQQFFDAAIAIAYANVEDMDPRLTAKMFQEYYKMECELGIAENCFAVIIDFVDWLESFESLGKVTSNQSRKAFLADFRFKLEQMSEYGTGKDGTDSAFAKRISKDDELYFYWLQYGALAARPSMQKTVSLSLGLTKSLKLAKLISVGRVIQ